MRYHELIREGGWEATVTQNTQLQPRVVGQALKVLDNFVAGFNQQIQDQDIGQIRRGRPTGSSAHHEKDAVEDPDKIYGDIDIQMVAPESPGMSYFQFTDFWNKLSHEYLIKQPYVFAPESKPGHPVLQIGKDAFVSVDLMWHPVPLEKWGAARVTPERGVKGSLYGNMWSVFGEILDMSIQHAGVQLKVVDNVRVPFSKQKNTQVVTVTTNPDTFILDTFRYLAQQQGIQDPKIAPDLERFSGADMNNPSIARLVQGMKAFAASAQANGMFGKGDLAPFSGAGDFLNKFMQRYEEKAMIDLQGKKRDKAQTPAAIARAESDRNKILQGLETVKGYFK